MAVNTYEFNVTMTCGGCSGAVTRVLTKLQTEGLVTSFNVEQQEHRVTVAGPILYDDLRARIAKTGKTIVSGKTISSETGPAAPTGVAVAPV